MSGEDEIVKVTNAAIAMVTASCAGDVAGSMEMARAYDGDLLALVTMLAGLPGAVLAGTGFVDLDERSAAWSEIALGVARRLT